MKLHLFIFPFIAVVFINVLLAIRDTQSINNAHENACATLPQPHPDCQ
ncbi:hypothetical protein [Synechococcus phage S-B43]|jgi:hypothetical protein|nr:hypothetical protein [Synechococcus phage S-B43]